MLSDWQIARAIGAGEIGVDPMPDVEQVQPASLDLRIGGADAPHESSLESTGFYAFEPHQFHLATTVETIDLPDWLGATVWGRSSFGREGLEIHRAGFLDPGFEGEITLEVVNDADEAVFVTTEERVCQVCFHPLGAPCMLPYGEKPDAKYQDQSGPTESQR